MCTCFYSKQQVDEMIENISLTPGPEGPQGEPGDTPYIQGGTWWIGDTDTGVLATGPPGAQYAFEAHAQNQQDIPSTQIELVELTTLSFGYGVTFSFGGHSVRPDIEGYWYIYGGLRYESSMAGYRCQARLNWNSSLASYGTLSADAGDWPTGPFTPRTLYFDGVNDIVRLYTYHTHPDPKSIGPDHVFLGGHLVRAI